MGCSDSVRNGDPPRPSIPERTGCPARCRILRRAMWPSNPGVGAHVGVGLGGGCSAVGPVTPVAVVVCGEEATLRARVAGFASDDQAGAFGPMPHIDEVGVGSDRGALSAFRLVGFPGPPSEPDVQLPLHPALHVFMPLLVQPVSASHVPAARPQPGQRCAGIHQRPPRSTVRLRTHWTPSPCDRLSRPRTTTGPPPHPTGISRQRTFPPTNLLLAGEGTDGMVPTFTSQPFDRVSVQLCPLQHRHGYAAAIHRGLPSRRPKPTKESPHTASLCGCALLRGPNPPGSSRWVS